MKLSFSNNTRDETNDFGATQKATVSYFISLIFNKIIQSFPTIKVSEDNIDNDLIQENLINSNKIKMILDYQRDESDNQSK